MVVDLDHLARLATEATSGPWWVEGCDDVWADTEFITAYRHARRRAESPGQCRKNANYIAAFNPEVTAALVEVARAAKSVIHPKLDEWSFPRWDEASAKAVAESKLRDALAKLDNLEVTE